MHPHYGSLLAGRFATLVAMFVLVTLAACADGENQSTRLLDPQTSAVPEPSEDSVTTQGNDCIPLGTDVALSGPNSISDNLEQEWTAALCGQQYNTVIVDWIENFSTNPVTIDVDTVTLDGWGTGEAHYRKTWLCGDTVPSFTLTADVRGGQRSSEETISESHITESACVAPETNISGPTGVCPNGSYEYTWKSVHDEDPWAPWSYQWYEDGTPVGTQSSYSKTPTSEGSFTIKLEITDSANPSQTNSDSTSVTADYFYCPHSPEP